MTSYFCEHEGGKPEEVHDPESGVTEVSYMTCKTPATYRVTWTLGLDEDETYLCSAHVEDTVRSMLDDQSLGRPAPAWLHIERVS